MVGKLVLNPMIPHCFVLCDVVGFDLSWCEYRMIFLCYLLVSQDLLCYVMLCYCVVRVGLV